MPIDIGNSIKSPPPVLAPDLQGLFVFYLREHIPLRTPQPSRKAGLFSGDSMKFTKYALLAVLLLPIVALTEGTTAHVSFTFATEAIRTDPVTGVKTTVPLAISDIASTTIQWFVGTAKVGEKVVTAPAAAADIPGLICGNYDFRAFHTHKQGSAGELSNTVAYATEVACTVPKGPVVSVR